ncbi:MAG: hypothetical protein EAZ07_01120 [Cytophagales bacterium]|nr:MAG: hypothetical protein EAZ07_01120 [Cytophagales bacterium]
MKYPLIETKFNFLLTLIFILGINSIVNAQSGGQVEERVVVIEKESKIDLPNANRNYEKISTLPVSPKPLAQSYSFEDINITLPKVNTKIKVPTLPSEALTKLYPYFVKAGFGNYGTSFLEGFINNKRSDKLNYGLHFYHMASANGAVKTDLVKNFSRNSSNLVNGHIQYFTKKNTINAEMGFARTRFNYYGLNTSVLDTLIPLNKFNKETIKQVYNTFEIGTSIENTNKTDPLDYKLGLKFYNFNDFYKASENEIVAQATTSYDLSNKDGININAELSNSTRKDSSSINRTFFILKPKYWLNYGVFSGKVGFNIAYTNDTISAFNKLHFYPSFHGEAMLKEQSLIVFAGLDGEMQKNTWRSFAKENPYIGNNTLLYHTNKALELYGGAKGSLMQRLNYQVKLGYANYKNLYLYNNSINDSSRFSVFYSPANSSIVNFTTDLSYELQKRWNIGVEAQFFGYTIGSSDSLKIGAWHRPTSKINCYSTYNLNNKIYFNFNFYYIGGIKARQFSVENSKDIELPSIIDLSLKVEYKVSNSFSAFIELNNLLNKKYQLYQYYPSLGANFLIGLTYSF